MLYSQWLKYAEQLALSDDTAVQLLLPSRPSNSAAAQLEAKVRARALGASCSCPRPSPECQLCTIPASKEPLARTQDSRCGMTRRWRALRRGGLCSSTQRSAAAATLPTMKILEPWRIPLTRIDSPLHLPATSCPLAGLLPQLELWLLLRQLLGLGSRSFWALLSHEQCLLINKQSHAWQMPRSAQNTGECSDGRIICSLALVVVP